MDRSQRQALFTSHTCHGTGPVFQLFFLPAKGIPSAQRLGAVGFAPAPTEPRIASSHQPQLSLLWRGGEGWSWSWSLRWLVDLSHSRSTRCVGAERSWRAFK